MYVPAPYLATISFRRTNHVLRIEQPLGEPAGYASLEQALAAARPATLGVTTAAAAVLMAGGRYTLHSIAATSWIAGHPGTDTPPEPFTLIEQLASSATPDAVRELTWLRDAAGDRHAVHPGLVALVDGVTALRVR